MPEEHGGGSLSGNPVQDAVIVAEEMGRLVAPGPFLAGERGRGRVAAEGSDEQQADAVPGLLVG